MLVLSRKANDAVLIGENISLHVLGIKGRRVQIGIEAPADIAITRSELRESNLASQTVADEPASKIASAGG